MPQVRVLVLHALNPDVAIDRLREYSRQMQNDYGDQVSNMEETWTADGVADFSFRVMGFKVTGTTTVIFGQVEVEVQLPFAAIPLRGLIEKEIAKRLEAALAEPSE